MMPARSAASARLALAAALVALSLAACGKKGAVTDLRPPPPPAPAEQPAQKPAEGTGG
ncbi:MAG: hypothetical protein U1E52_08110 [Geminicoccaceae bacterium]